MKIDQTPRKQRTQKTMKNIQIQPSNINIKPYHISSNKKQGFVHNQV
jgi:ABC-type antimicrobial peptide transport system ATPase subunit